MTLTDLSEEGAGWFWHRQGEVAGFHQLDALIAQAEHVHGVLGIVAILGDQFETVDPHPAAIPNEALALLLEVAHKLGAGLSTDDIGGEFQQLGAARIHHHVLFREEEHEDGRVAGEGEPEKFAEAMEDEIQIAGFAAGIRAAGTRGRGTLDDGLRPRIEAERGRMGVEIDPHLIPVILPGDVEAMHGRAHGGLEDDGIRERHRDSFFGNGVCAARISAALSRTCLGRPKH